VSAGTPVLTEAGPRPIEQVREGDRVWAHDPATGQNVLREVTATHTVAEGEAVYHIFVAGERLEATGSHPFLAVGRWEDARNLRPGDSLWLYQGRWAVVDSVGVRPGPATTYNLSVQGLPTFYVSRTGVLGHNCPDGKLHGNDKDKERDFIIYRVDKDKNQKASERLKYGKGKANGPQDEMSNGTNKRMHESERQARKKYPDAVATVVEKLKNTKNSDVLKREKTYVKDHRAVHGENSLPLNRERKELSINKLLKINLVSL
jgi:hypothetical protein